MHIELDAVCHTYQPGTALSVDALKEASLSIDQTDFAAIVGPTGSGKSTLVQHLNGLLAPTAGRVLVDGVPPKRQAARELRSHVGLVFQFPENQFFEATVREDVAFGPRNLSCGAVEAGKRVTEALDMVGLDPDLFGPRNPFELSGGEKRRVAIAGVLAMRPRIIVLDEPTAGLDPVGRRELMAHLRDLHYREGIGVVIVSHALDEIAELVERLIVMREGRIVFDGRPSVAFEREELLARAGLDPPQGVATLAALRRRGLDVAPGAVTIDDVARAVADAVEKSDET